MRDPNPVSGNFDSQRYSGQETDGTDSRKQDVPPGHYNYRGTTLEEEAFNGGWRPGDRPTTTAPFVIGDDPRLTRDAEPGDLFTVGMRGEPGWDDDPQFNNDAATVTHPPAK
jgi:hypothetical protein